jgi:hypothetical protein
VYQVILLGQLDYRTDAIRQELVARVVDLGLDPDAVHFITQDHLDQVDRRLPRVAVYSGGPATTRDTNGLDELLADSAVVVPLVSTLESVTVELPAQLRHLNAVAADNSSSYISRVASLVLETFRLLRSERRLFISYRRVDSHALAAKLYDALDARGFDVFIDVRSVPPAQDFQAVLWHRMADSDILLLIDTPGFRESRWTTEELARANATNIQILHLLWPGQREDDTSAFSHFLHLDSSDFEQSTLGVGEHVRAATVDRICITAEQLRARAIAARYRYLVDNFCDAARDCGLDPVVHPDRWISLTQSSGSTLAVIPAVGIPTSDRLNLVFNSISDADSAPGEIWVIYDNRGLLQSWLSHLDWLDEHLPMRTVRVTQAPQALRTLTA